MFGISFIYNICFQTSVLKLILSSVYFLLTEVTSVA